METQGKWLLPFLGTAQKLNVEPSLFIKTLEEEGWLVTDILSPMRKVQVIDQVRGMLLATEPSGFMKQLIAVSNVSVAPSEAAQKPINATPSKNNKAKPLPTTQTEQPGKQQKLKPGPTANTREPADKLQAVETILSIPSSANSTKPKPEEFSQPKPESVSEPAIMQKPEKQKALVATVSKTAAAQHSTPSILANSPAVVALINYLRKTRPISEATTADNAWYSVEESDIAQCLTQHPRLKRSALLREIASHPDCRIDEGCIKVRISP